MLKLENALQQSMTTLEENGFVGSRTDAEPDEVSSQSIGSGKSGFLTESVTIPTLKKSITRSQSRDGQVSTYSGNNSTEGALSKSRLVTGRLGKSKSSEGAKPRPRQTLPSVSQTPADRYASLETVQEGTSMIHGTGSVRRKYGSSISRSSQSADSIRGGISNAEEVVHNPSSRSHRMQTTVENKHVSKGKKPEWVEIRSGEGVGYTTKVKPQGGDAVEPQQPVTGAHLAECAKEIYSQKIEIPVEKEKEKKKKLLKKKPDKTFSRRRRSLNDPRNALETNKKSKKRCIRRVQPTETISSNVTDEADNRECSLVLPPIDRPSLSKTPAASSPQKADIIAVHRAPNLRVAKKIKFRVKNKLIEPKAAVAMKDLKSSVGPQLTSVSPQHNCTSRIRISAMDAAEDDMGDGGADDYADEVFDSDFDGACAEPLAKSEKPGGAARVHEPFSSSDFFVMTNDTNDLLSQESPKIGPKKPLEASRSPTVKDVIRGDVSHVTIRTMEGRNSQGLPLSKSIFSPQNKEVDYTPDDDIISVPTAETGSSGLDMAYRMMSPNPRPIETISGRPFISQHGSRSSKRPTSSTLLPFYENTEPLVINAVPNSPGSSWGSMGGSPMLDYCTVSGGVSTPTSAAGRRYSRGSVNRLERIEDGREETAFLADPPDGGRTVPRSTSRKSRQKVSQDAVTTRVVGRSESLGEVTAAVAATVRRAPRKLSLPTNTMLRESLQLQVSAENETANATSVNIDSKKDQVSVNRKKSMRRPMTKADDVVASIHGEPTSLDINILKSTGALRRKTKKMDSFEEFTRQMACRRKSSVNGSL